MAKARSEILFRIHGIDYDSEKLARTPVEELENLLESVGAARERQGLVVARMTKALDDARQEYKQLTEARNKLKAVLVPGVGGED